MQQHRWSFFILLMITIVLYYPSLQNDFLASWDDDAYIINNPDVHGLTTENCKKIFSSYYVGNYQPLSMLSYAIEVSVAGLNPMVFHATNMLLHMGNSLLTYWFVWMLLYNVPAAFFAALVFAIHPMHVESVAWIAERKDLLYALFYLLSLIHYIKYIEGKKNIFYVYSVVFFLCSLLSKSMAVSLPVVLLIIDFYKKRPLSVSLLLSKFPFFLLFLLFGIIALRSQAEQAMVIAVKLPFVYHILQVCYSISYYLVMFIFPFRFSALHYYPPSLVDGHPEWYFYVIPLFLLAVCFFPFIVKKYRSELLFGLLFFIVSIAPVLQIIPIGLAIVSERYTYMPYTGLLIPASLYASSYFSSRVFSFEKIPVLLMSFLCIFYFVSSYKRIPQWKNSITLFTDVTEKYPHAAHAHWTLGNTHNTYKNYSLAIASFDKAIALDASYAMAFFNRGLAKYNKKDLRGALADYNTTLSLRPDYVPAYVNKGNVYLDLKQYEKALELYNTALSSDSAHQLALLYKSNALIQLKRIDEAVDVLNTLIRINPHHGEAYYYRGVIYYNRQQREEACADFKKSYHSGYDAVRDIVYAQCGGM